MAEWVLYGMMGIPLICGVLALLTKHDRLRNVIVALSAVAVAVGGLALVWESLQSSTPGKVWSLTAPVQAGWIGSGLELVIIAVIFGVALKIRNFWIALFGVIQFALGLAVNFLPAHEGETELVLFRIDDLTRIMLLVTSLVGATILIFAIGYMKEHAKHAPPTAGSNGRFFFYFISFVGFMIGLVCSNHLSFFSFFWEATTFCSYALIGQDGGEARRVNAVRALFINSFGGVLLLAGIFLLKWNTGGESFEAILANKSITLLPAVLLCVAAFTKSALFPFQSWLLGAMVAPTPVSAMLHAATMVKAGVYLVMRITPGFYNERAMMVVAFAGALSFVGGALLAGTQSNAKKVLAYSTISNLGLVVACAGIDSPLAYAAGLAIITFHAISKGLLFLCVGRIEQKIGSRDIEDMDGLIFKMPFTTCVALLGMMSMLLPPFGMLLSKWLAIEATIRSPFLLVFMVLGSALTVFFWAKWIGRMQNTGYHEHMHKEDISLAMRIAMSLLAVMILGTGLTTMLIFGKVFVPMTHSVFDSVPNANWQALSEPGTFSAVVIFAAVGAGLLIYYFVFWRRFRKENIRLPFLCGENIEIDNVDEDTDVRSYDFHSVCGKVEHCVFSSFYFHGIISEKLVTMCLNWAAWLIIVVLIGNSIMATR